MKPSQGVISPPGMGGRFFFNKMLPCLDALLQVRADRVMQNQGGLHRTAKLQIKVEAERVTHKRTHVSSERFAVKCRSATRAFDK